MTNDLKMGLEKEEKTVTWHLFGNSIKNSKLIDMIWYSMNAKVTFSQAYFSYLPRKSLFSYIYTVVAKMIKTLVFSPAKMVLSQLFLSFAVYVSVGNISLHFPLTVIIQWYLCLHKESDNSQRSDPHRDLISSSSSGLSGITWRNRTNWARLNPEELTSPRCLQKPTSKATWNTVKCT